MARGPCHAAGPRALGSTDLPHVAEFVPWWRSPAAQIKGGGYRRRSQGGELLSGAWCRLMGDAGQHPMPPEDLFQRQPLLRVHAGPWFRIHGPKHSAIYFGTAASNRFDDPAGEFGVLYLAEDIFGAFIETIGQPTGTHRVAESTLRAYTVSRIHSSRPLHLIDLAASGGLVHIGADNGLCDGSHEISRNWSRALHRHPVDADGILYRVRHDPARLASALFDRCRGIMREERLGTMAEPSLVETIGTVLEHYRFDLFPG